MGSGYIFALFSVLVSYHRIDYQKVKYYTVLAGKQRRGTRALACTDQIKAVTKTSLTSKIEN